MDKLIFTIDGSRISDLETFYDEFAYIFLPDIWWGRNLDALNDVFRGGFGIPDENFILVWKNSDRSREALGYGATVQFWENAWNMQKRRHILEELMRRGHKYSENEANEIEDALDSLERIDPRLAQKLALAKAHNGETIFDIIVEILHSHSKVELRLE